MFNLLPGLCTILLSGLYFFDASGNPEATFWQHVALVASGVLAIGVGYSANRQARLAQARGTELAASEQGGVGYSANHQARLAQAPGEQVAAALAVAPAGAGKDGPTVDRKAPQLPGATGQDVLSFLRIMQDKGRLIDFLMDDVSKYTDSQVGAAARVVHQGAGAALREYFDIKPVHEGEEGAALVLDKDYDAHSYRLLGHLAGEAPFRGHVLHRGWLTTSIKLPVQTPAAADVPLTAQRIITPAEVELS